MMSSNDLIDTIEKIRQERFPDLPAELVAEIVSVEQKFVDNRVEAFKRINQAIDNHLIAKSL
jgi:hypothetical protein